MKRAALGLLILVGCTKSVAPREAFRAVGTEPFWALQIDSAGLRFSTPEDQAGTLYPAVELGQAGDTLLWKATLGDRLIEARIWRAACSDGMSDRKWPYAARVVVGGQTVRGCAGSPGAPPTGAAAP